MAIKMGFVNLFLIWLFLQDQSVLTDSRNTVFTTEMSSINLTFKGYYPELRFKPYGEKNKTYYYNSPNQKYNMVLSPDILKFPIINVTARDKGYYRINTWIETYSIMLNITDKSCPSSKMKQVCAIAGSSPILKFVHNGQSFYSGKPYFFKVELSKRLRSVSNFTIHTDIQIYNVTLEDTGLYTCELYSDDNQIRLRVANVNVWFLNQKDQNTIVGQEGKAMKINCRTNTSHFITALKIESSGSMLAMGDKKSVSYSFVPKRTDHLTTYKYAPVVHIRFTNEAVYCDCDGIPDIYSVYLLNQISEYGDLVRSVNLNYDTFTFNKFPFPYQRNGRYTCIVSNGISDINGKVIRNGSAHFIYEGPPIFAKENKAVKIGKVGQSITLTFLVYIYPHVVEELFIRSTQNNKRKVTQFNVLNTTLLYTEFDNKVGIQGYEISIESQKLNLDDFQAYCITVKNRLGSGNYNFEIIKKEDIATTQRKRTQFLILSIVSVILSVYIIFIHVYLCAKHLRTESQRGHNVPANNNYHTYDEIRSMSYNTVSNVPSSSINENNVPNPTRIRASDISNRENVRFTNDNMFEDIEVHSYLDFDLPLPQVGEIQEVGIANSSVETNVFDIDVSRILPTLSQSTDIVPNDYQGTANINAETSSYQSTATSYDSDSDSSGNSMIVSVGDVNENPYESISQERPESHQYIEIVGEVHRSVSSTESNCEEQIFERDSKKASYVNLQF